MNYSGWHNKEGQEVLRSEIKRLKEVKNIPYSTFVDEVISLPMFFASTFSPLLQLLFPHHWGGEF